MQIKYTFKLFLVILLIHTGNSLCGQSRITPLKIGDHVPDLVISNLLKRQGSMRLADLHKQDLLLINFWATWCAPCIKELPKLDSLSAANPEKMKVLSVAYESEAIVKSFFMKHPEIPMAHLFITTEDTVLIEYFKHRVIPHNIWIDRNGFIKNITGQEEISSRKIADFINKGVLQADAKNDLIDFDMHRTFHLKDSDFIYRSILTGFADGIGGGTSLQAVWHHPTERWLIRLFAFNSTKQQILWKALNHMNSFKDYYHVLQIQTSDSTRFFWPKECPQSFARAAYPSERAWRKENLYCYELTLPRAVRDTDFFGFMKGDIEKAFQVKISREFKKMLVCIIGVKNSRSFSVPQNDSSYIDLTATMLKVHNIPVIRLFQFLNEKVKPGLNAKPADPPFIDRTGIGHHIDLAVSFDREHPTYKEIKEMLKAKYGFSWAIREQDYPVYIVKDLVP